MNPKYDIEIAKFVSCFSAYKDKKIILYGTGRMTMTLLSRNIGFKFVGLCDRDSSLIGKVIGNVPVVDQKTAEKTGDLLIINTSETYWNAIFQRIQHWNIPIYFLDGLLATRCKKFITEDLSYWKTSLDELKKRAEACEIVSFDIFDTLIMRKVLYPADVLRILHEHIHLKYEMDFYTVRKQAAAQLKHPNIHQIYRRIAEITDLSESILDEWKQKEISLEEILQIPRRDMVALCQTIMKQKEVYFISDMYFPKEWMQKQLERIGITTELDHILVSCDVQKSKETGDLWAYYQQNYLRGKSALHIGDNLVSDEAQPKKYGIQTYRIMAATEQLQRSSLCAIIPYIESVYASIGMGLLCAELFNSPFALNTTKGQVRFVSNQQAGYCLLGPVMDTFCRWLLQRAKRDNIKQYLFFARDGYLLLPLFQFCKELFGEENLTKDHYLEISRRAIWTCSVLQESDIFDIAQFPYQGTLKNFLRDRFGLMVSGSDDIYMDTLQQNANSLKDALQPFLDQILERCQWEKENYNRYLQKLDINSQFAVVDSQFYGTTQYYFAKYMQQKIPGYYMCANTNTCNPYMQKNPMYGCFQGEIPESRMVHKQAQFLESYFTAPHGMLCYIDCDGLPVYAPPMSNQVYFYVRQEMQEGIKDFFLHIYQVCSECEITADEGDWYWSDATLGVGMDHGYDVTEDMKRGFYFDNGAVNYREMPIWE